MSILSGWVLWTGIPWGACSLRRRIWQGSSGLVPDRKWSKKFFFNQANSPLEAWHHGCGLQTVTPWVWPTIVRLAGLLGKLAPGWMLSMTTVYTLLLLTEAHFPVSCNGRGGREVGQPVNLGPQEIVFSSTPLLSSNTLPLFYIWYPTLYKWHSNGWPHIPVKCFGMTMLWKVLCKNK